MEQQVDVAQPQALPADIEAILQPISADHHQAPQAEPVVEQAQVQPVVAPPAQPVAPPPSALSPEAAGLLRELKEERKARQAYEARLWQFNEAQQRASQPQPQPIDPVAEPERFAAAVQQELARKDQQMRDMAIHNRANTSEMLAKSKYGAQAVEAARDAVIAAGLGEHFLHKSTDPYEDVVAWHRGQAAAKEIGDPTTYKERLKAEILAELAKGMAAPAARPGVPQVLPPSLSSATRASTVAPVIQDSNDFFKSMFAKPQRT